MDRKGLLSRNRRSSCSRLRCRVPMMMLGRSAGRVRKVDGSRVLKDSGGAVNVEGLSMRLA